MEMASRTCYSKRRLVERVGTYGACWVVANRPSMTPTQSEHFARLVTGDFTGDGSQT